MTFFWTVNLDNNYFVARAGGAVCSAQHGAAGAAGRGLLVPQARDGRGYGWALHEAPPGQEQCQPQVEDVCAVSVVVEQGIPASGQMCRPVRSSSSWKAGWLAPRHAMPCARVGSDCSKQRNRARQQQQKTAAAASTAVATAATTAE